MHDAQVDEARLLAAGDHLDREAERLLGAPQERLRVPGDAQRVRPHHAHRAARHPGEPFREALERRERALLRFAIQVLVGGEAAAEPHRLLHGIERIELLAGDARDREVEAVAAEVDRAEGVIFHG